MAKLKSLLVTLALGFIGALTATYLGLPAAALIGASIAVSIGALLKLTSELPSPLYNIAFAVIGCSLGSGITREALAQSIHWPISLLTLGCMVVVIVMVSSWILQRFFSIQPETAVLSSTPGAFVFTIAMAASGKADIRTVLVIQNIRLLVVTSLLPFILDHLSFESRHNQQSVGVFQVESYVMIAISLTVGVVMLRWKIPASFLLAGMLISGVGHYLDLVTGRPPLPLIFMSFVITGSMVGSRFSSISRTDLGRLLGASIAIVCVAGLLLISFAYPVALILELPLGQILVAYAPGGVEAMAAIALSMGYDPAFVATHHLFRLLLLFLVFPVCIKLAERFS